MTIVYMLRVTVIAWMLGEASHALLSSNIIIGDLMYTPSSSSSYFSHNAPRVAVEVAIYSESIKLIAAAAG